jgi:hypothetical protein
MTAAFRIPLRDFGAAANAGGDLVKAERRKWSLCASTRTLEMGLRLYQNC